MLLSSLAHDLPRWFVVAKTFVTGLAQHTLLGPLGKANLGNKVGPNELHVIAWQAGIKGIGLLMPLTQQFQQMAMVPLVKSASYKPRKVQGLIAFLRVIANSK